MCGREAGRGLHVYSVRCARTRAAAMIGRDLLTPHLQPLRADFSAITPRDNATPARSNHIQDVSLRLPLLNKTTTPRGHGSEIDTAAGRGEFGLNVNNKLSVGNVI